MFETARRRELEANPPRFAQTKFGPGLPVGVRDDDAQSGGRLILASPGEVEDGLALAGGLPDVVIDDLIHGPDGTQPALIQQDRSAAQVANGREIVADEQNRSALVGDVLHPTETATLKRQVPHRQDLVDEQDLGLEVRSDGEGKAKVHAG